MLGVAMEPIAIFRHAAIEGPGLLAEFLDEQSIPWQLICIDAGEAVPISASAFSGLVLMGGPMSVNDELPWISPVLELIREAVALDIPVLGHCLGGQLMSKALGGRVTRNPVKEIGWGRVAVGDREIASDWLGDCHEFEAFHWHGETFSLPPGAELLLSSKHCAHQGFVSGKHLGLQCHVEMTEAMIRDWCEVGADEIASCPVGSAVQKPAQIQAEMNARLPQLHAVARRIYARWVKGVHD